MGSLEDKVGRLSPEQRREAEMFIDFLLQKQAGSGKPDTTPNPFLAPDHSPPVAPPIIMADEIHSTPHDPRPAEHLPSLGDLQVRNTSHAPDEGMARPKKKDPGLLLDWID